MGTLFMSVFEKMECQYRQLRRNAEELMVRRHTGFVSHRWSPLVAAALLLALSGVSTALAAEAQKAGHGSGSPEALLLVQIVILILTGRLLGEILERIGLPAVMGQLLAGMLLGPSVFGLLWPAGQSAVFPDAPEQRAMLDAVSQVGILLLLLLSGMETDLSLVRKVKRAAASASLAGVILPFTAGFLLGQALPASILPDPKHRLITSLFIGTALSISSVKIVATVVRQMDFVRRNVGQVILASALIDDTIGWIIIAITFGLAEHGTFNGWLLTRSVLGTFLFLGLSFTIGRRFVFKIIRLTNDHFVSESAVVAAILVVMGTMALITHWIGVHTVLGAFVAGILVGGSPILTKEIDGQVRGITTGLFMPVFFGAAGLHTDLTVLDNPRFLLLTVGMILIATIGKTLGAFIGGWSGGLRSREAVALATGMNARGSTEIIVATIGLSLGVLSRDLFTMIVTMAVVTTLLMPLTLRRALRRLPLEGEEKKRLEREAFEEKGFVPSMERVLLTVDESSSGKLATRLAGLLAGRRGMPLTILSLPASGNGAAPKDEEHALLKSVRDVLQGAAEQVGNPGKGEAERPSEVEVTAQIRDLPPAEAVETEAAKGYDVLMIGMEPATTPKGVFAGRLSKVAGSFEGTLGIAVARGAFAKDPLDQGIEILVPITGSGPSLRGAEVALALAQAASAPITALAIASAGAQSAREGRHGQGDDAKILREITRLAKYFDVKVNRLTGTGAAQDAIRKAASGKRRCLIVLGASRRPGESLSLGPLAAGLLDHSKHALLLISS
jgi:Kef-type K+ transport system membrane component KefB/nucleotide-binding universal stress UspA family protein